MLRKTFAVLCLIHLLFLTSCVKSPLPALQFGISAITPNSGPLSGGTVVTITGMGLTGGIQVFIGTNLLTNLTVVNGSTLTGTAPRGDSPCAVDVTIKRGAEEAKLAGGFTYLQDDTTAPTIASRSPEQDQRVGIDAKLVVVFSESMAESTMIAANIYIKNIIGTVAYDSQSRAATFTPGQALAPDRSYEAVVTTDVTDLSGNHLGQQASWGFRTRPAGTLPRVVFTLSAAGGKGTSANYKLFSVTGQPTPLAPQTRGQSENYKIEAGFTFSHRE